jgi:hypothetical protein
MPVGGWVVVRFGEAVRDGKVDAVDFSGCTIWFSGELFDFVKPTAAPAIAMTTTAVLTEKTACRRRRI